MKRIVRLTESDLRNVVRRSVNKILREYGSDGPDFDEPYAYKGLNGGVPEYAGHVQSASDFDSNEDFLNFDGKYDEDDELEFNDDDLLNFESRRRAGRVIREGEYDNIDVDGLYNSLKTYNDNPVNIQRDINYEPSDEEIMAAAGDFDLDTDFSDLMGGNYNESRRRMGRIIRESIKKVINEGNDDWQNTYKDNKGRTIQSRGSGSKKQWRAKN